MNHTLKIWIFLFSILSCFSCDIKADELTGYFRERQIKTKPAEGTEKIEQIAEEEKSEVKPESAIVSEKDLGPFFEVTEIQISDNTLLSKDELLKDLPEIFSPENRPKTKYDFTSLRNIIDNPGQISTVSAQAITGLTEYILHVYNQKGYAGVYVYVPQEIVIDKEQLELKDKILVVKVLEAKVTKTSVTYYKFNPSNDPNDTTYIIKNENDPKYMNASFLVERSPVNIDKVVKKRELDEYINLLNLNPDRFVLPIISRGKTSDSLGLEYRVYEQNPWHLHVQSDNSGSKERRWNPKIGVINTNLTGRDDKFMGIYQGPLQDHPLDPFDENYSIYGNYEFPLFCQKLRAGIYAGHSSFDISSDIAGGRDFLGNGDYYGATLRYNLLQSKQKDPWFLDLTNAISREESRINPTIGQDTDIDMDIWTVGIDLYRTVRRDDEYSSTSFRYTRQQSVSSSSTEEFEKARLNSDPDFAIHSFSAFHSRYLDPLEKIHQVRGSFRWIEPTERLVPAKMTTFGGLYTVRGYSEDEIVSDGGMIYSFEYEHDISHYLGINQNLSPRQNNSFLRRAGLVLFFDGGRAVNKHKVPGEEGVQELNSVGIGLTASIGENLDGAVYYGYPLTDTFETDEGDARWNFSFIYRL